MKLDHIQIETGYHAEPVLEFGGERLHVSPQMGICLFGPRSLGQHERHPDSIQVGFIGSGKSIDSARKWIESCTRGIPGDEEEIDFPGFHPEHGFYSEIAFSDSLNENITINEMREIVKPRLLKDRFELALALTEEKLRLLSEKDRAPNFLVLALPDEMLKHCKVVDFRTADLGAVHRDFRRAVKSVAMKHHLPAQILLQRTSEATPQSRNVDHKSQCAWNFFTGLYYKSGGIPWSPSGLPPGTCYIGVSFHRTMGSKRSTYFTSTAQAFNERGEGLVLRGQDFTWSQKGKSPHLSKQLANQLVGSALKRYQDEMKQVPTRVVIHKTSKFWPEEREGFEEALEGVYQYDLLALNTVSDTRVLRDGQYPILRGTQVKIGEQHLLYTTGYIPALNAYPHGHVPSPILVFEHIGDTDIDSLLKEVLLLTKMNWNSSAFACSMPITLQFSRLVGEIMNEIPPDREPLTQFKYYM